VTARRTKRGHGVRAIVVILACFLVALLSLAVRWLGVGRNLVRSEVPFQIEVLNGTGEPRVAMQAATALRRAGIDVLIVDNAERNDFRESVLVDRRGNRRLVRRLAKTLHCRAVLEQIRDHSLVDATYVIGADKVGEYAR
jgi:hypothetical protein